MESITVKCLLAGNKARLGVTSEAGLAGRARRVSRAQNLSGPIDKFCASPLLPATILVAPTGYAELASGKTRREFLATVRAARGPCLAVCGVNALPDFLIRFAEQTSTVVFGSRFDDNLLASRLAGLLREKLHGRIFVQGALVNVYGLGVLITGVSGVGKTTLALAMAGRGHKWIADDAVEIEKQVDGRLHGRSHALVKNLLEIKEIGFFSVRDVLSAASIDEATPVDMVAEIGGHSSAKPYSGKSYRRIMGVRLPLFKIPITRCHDRDEQLEIAAKTISQTG